MLHVQGKIGLGARRASVVWPPAVNALRPDPHLQRRKSSCMEACGPAVTPVVMRPCVSLLSKRSPASLLAEQAAGHRARASLQLTQREAEAGHHQSGAASLQQTQWDAGGPLSAAAARACLAGSEAGAGSSQMLPLPPVPRLRRSGGRMLRVLRSAHHASTASSEGGSSLRWTDWSSFGSGATGVSEKRPCTSPGAPPLEAVAEKENSGRIARLFASAFLPTRGCLF